MKRHAGRAGGPLHLNTGEPRTPGKEEGRRQPVCPVCRAPLARSGACLACHGSRTPQDRYSWTFPGDRYETHDEQGRPVGNGDEWIWQQAGPRPACRPEDNAEQAGMIARVLGAFERRVKALNL